MGDFHDYFLCEECGNRHFKPISSFSIRFYGVNFSDKLVYDKLTEESYQCTQCNKIYTIEQIDEKLAAYKELRMQTG